MIRTNIKNHTGGFIALMSAMIISAIMIGILFTVNRTSFYARFDALDRESKDNAYALAGSCMNKALLKLAQDYSYDPINEELLIGDDACFIVSTTPHGPRTDPSTKIIILTKGIYKNSFSTVEAKVTALNPANRSPLIPSPENITINSWTEITDSGP